MPRMENGGWRRRKLRKMLAHGFEPQLDRKRAYPLQILHSRHWTLPTIG
jgi:hypothetical protein